ncbi:MAG: DNA pilot protein [Microvirus sp.]|nr:MAG: DNA pilot protein [Microvirus sp.]
MGLKKLGKKVGKTIKKVAPYAAAAGAIYSLAPAAASLFGKSEDPTPTPAPAPEASGGTPRETVTGNTGNWNAAVTGGASLLGGYISNTANAKQASQQMDFQASQTGTAHQREVADLKAAGLNPILSGTGGAGAASGSGSFGQQTDMITPAVSAAANMRLNNETLHNLRQQTATSASQESVYNAQADLTEASTNESKARTALTAYDAASKAAQVRSASAKAALDELDVARAVSERDFYASKAGKWWPYASRGVELAEGATSAFRNAIPVPKFELPKKRVSDLPHFPNNGAPDW